MAVAAHYGGEVAWHCEIEPAAVQLLAHHYPDIPNLGDITTVDWSQVEPVDIITGGFPCQDVSHAGLGKGIRPGTRSGLWSQMAFAIETLQPTKVIIENVRGLLTASAHSDMEPCPWCVGDRTDDVLRALGAVLGDLADLGFDAEWGSVRASDAGCCHARFRVFIVATHPARDSGSWPRLGGTQGRGEPSDGDRPDRGVGQLLPTPTRRDHKGAVADVTWDQVTKSRGEGGASSLPDVVSLLPTPQAHDAKGGKTREQVEAMRDATGAGVFNLCEEVQLLSTPTTMDTLEPREGEALDYVLRRGEEDGALRRSTGNLREDVVHLLPTPTSQASKHGATPDVNANGYGYNLWDIPHLLPTPAVNDMGRSMTVEQWDEWTEGLKGKGYNGNGHGKSLSIEARRLLPTPKASDGPNGGPNMRNGKGQIDALPAVQDFGPYTAAIRRWELVLGRPAPAPTEPNAAGQPRLSPRFTEWMMGLPDGWVTGIGLSRTAALKMLGNGVVPLQALTALRLLDGAP